MSKSNLFIAICILVIGCLSGFAYWSNNELTKQADIYWEDSLQELFSMYTDRGVMRIKKKPKEEQIFIEVEKLYKKENYLKGIAQLEQFLREDPGNEAVYIRLATLYALSEQIVTAQNYLHKIQENPLSEYTADALWFEALLSIKAQQIAEVKPLLEATIKANGNHKKKASEFLNRIN
ncbi:MAG: hypothetical protein MK212_09390 [Saprospiraceae bacterium]|nr:hypothetical protein [Saprospiraceae bacterium]